MTPTSHLTHTHTLATFYSASEKQASSHWLVEAFQVFIGLDQNELFTVSFIFQFSRSLVSGQNGENNFWSNFLILREEFLEKEVDEPVDELICHICGSNFKTLKLRYPSGRFISMQPL